MRCIFILVIVLGISACREDKFYYPEIVNSRNIQIDSIKFERLELNLNGYESSYYGYSFIDDSCIYYVDKYFCWLFAFTKDGSILFRKLGQGRGPGEVVCKKISGVARCQDHELLILGYTLDHYFFKEILIGLMHFYWRITQQKLFMRNQPPIQPFIRI